MLAIACNFTQKMECLAAAALRRGGGSRRSWARRGRRDARDWGSDWRVEGPGVCFDFWKAPHVRMTRAAQPGRSRNRRKTRRRLRLGLDSLSRRARRPGQYARADTHVRTRLLDGRSRHTRTHILEYTDMGSIIHNLAAISPSRRAALANVLRSLFWSLVSAALGSRQ